MKKDLIKLVLTIIVLSNIFYSCGDKFNEAEFDISLNKNLENDTIFLNMDLHDSIFSGISIPSEKIDNRKFFYINLNNINISSSHKYYYKIYYQNNSYKFNEFVKEDSSYNILSSENFYGSWENTNQTFKLYNNKLEKKLDSFRIIGNPRNEKKYYLPENKQKKVATQEKIAKIVNRIKNNGEWYSNVKKKALQNNISTNEQLSLDAIWMIENETSGKVVNNRWMRNPRVGNYEFILVLTSENDLQKIPDYIQNIGKVNNNSVFVNPFYYFNYGDGSKLEETYIYKSGKVVNISAKMNFKSGIYIDLTELKKDDYKKESLKENCNISENLFNYAHFEQFYHNINKNYPLNNIPVIADVTGTYSNKDYDSNKDKFPDNKRVKKNVAITDCPCKTANYNSQKNILEITVPGNKTEMRKENVGLKTRIGFTYGKYIAKIKFPKLISKDNVWNGVTNAFWLIYQDEHEWNYRRECNGGYIPPAEKWESGIRTKKSHYSEIDIEIIKTSEFWPKTSYSDELITPKDTPRDNRDIIVACTNWDLACQDPENFSVGAKKFKYNGKEYELHRWDHGYKAITHKAVVNHDWLLGEYTYYEIDWQPNKIIWRVGKDLNNMKVICEMDEKVTSIPNNQMVMVITQEFHDGKWWPTSPFHQDNIPFPEKDIKGEIMEIIIK